MTFQDDLVWEGGSGGKAIVRFPNLLATGEASEPGNYWKGKEVAAGGPPGHIQL